MNTLTQKITLAANKQLDKISNILASQQKRFESAASSFNSGAKPVLDQKGRFHAPFDGYVDMNDVEYLKGQYLPFDNFGDDYKTLSEFFGKKCEFKASVKIYSKMIDSIPTIDHVDFKFSKEWDCNGNKQCYAIVSAEYKSLLWVVENELKKEFDVISSMQDEEEKGEAPTGKHHVKCKVICIKPHYNAFQDDYSLKMTVELDNKSTAWGSLPSKITSAEAGDLIEFTATFENAKDDNTHSFFKRPSKAKILEKA